MGTQLTTTQKFKAWLDANANRIEPYIRVPKGEDPQQYLQDVKRALVMSYDSTPALQRCTPISMLKTACGLARYHVEIGGAFPEAYIVPYGQEAVGIVGYRGLIKLLLEGGTVEQINVVFVHEADEFQPMESMLQQDQWVHRPARRSRGPKTDVYSEFLMPGGMIRRFWMSVDEINEHGKLTSKTFGHKDSPWEKHWDAMASKTVIRLPISRGLIPIKFPRGVSASGALGDDATADLVIEPEQIEEEKPKQPPPRKPKVHEAAATVSAKATANHGALDAFKARLVVCDTAEAVDRELQEWVNDPFLTEDELASAKKACDERKAVLTGA